MTLSGIDVSAAGQGANFPWNSYKGKVQFAFAKVSEGLGFTDPDAAASVARMRAEGIVPGGYHFLHAGEGGAPQARYFLGKARAAGLGPGCLVGVDVEDEGLDGTSPAEMDLVAAGFINELRKDAGVWAVCYTEISLGASLMHCGNSPLWLANPSGMAVTRLGPWKGVSFEQTGQSGVDADVFYGTPAELAKLAIPG